MKKFFALVLAVALVCCMSTTAFAESYGTTNNTIPYYWYSDATISGQIYSSCTISIPETVYIGENAINEIAINNADIEENYGIVIRVTNLSETDTITLSNENMKKTIGCTIIGQNDEHLTKRNNVLAQITDVAFSGNNNSTDFITSFKALITEHAEAKAGTYTGTMQFEVMIEPY